MKTTANESSAVTVTIVHPDNEERTFDPRVYAGMMSAEQCSDLADFLVQNGMSPQE